MSSVLKKADKLNLSLLKLIVARSLCVSMWGKIMIPMYYYTTCMDYMDLTVCCPQRGRQIWSLIHS